MNDTFITAEMLKEKYGGGWLDEYYTTILPFFEKYYPEGVELSELMSDENQKRHHQGMYFAEWFNYTGEVKVYYSKLYGNGKVWSERTYKEGKLEGIFRWYYLNGQLLAETFFKNGLEDGVCKVYDEGGNLKSEETYKDGKLIEEKEYNNSERYL